MASPSILVETQVPADSPARALAGRTVTAPVETVEQIIARINEARRVGGEPTMQLVYTDSRWNRVVNPAALASALPALVAVGAEYTGHHTTATASVVVALLLAGLAGVALARANYEESQ